MITRGSEADETAEQAPLMAGAPYSTPPIVRVGRPARVMAGMPLIGG